MPAMTRNNASRDPLHVKWKKNLGPDSSAALRETLSKKLSQTAAQPTIGDTAWSTLQKRLQDCPQDETLAVGFHLLAALDSIDDPEQKDHLTQAIDRLSGESPTDWEILLKEVPGLQVLLPHALGHANANRLLAELLKKRISQAAPDFHQDVYNPPKDSAIWKWLKSTVGTIYHWTPFGRKWDWIFSVGLIIGGVISSLTGASAIAGILLIAIGAVGIAQSMWKKIKPHIDSMLGKDELDAIQHDSSQAKITKLAHDLALTLKDIAERPEQFPTVELIPILAAAHELRTQEASLARKMKRFSRWNPFSVRAYRYGAAFSTVVDSISESLIKVVQKVTNHLPNEMQVSISPEAEGMMSFSLSGKSLSAFKQLIDDMKIGSQISYQIKVASDPLQMLADFLLSDEALIKKKEIIDTPYGTHRLNILPIAKLHHMQMEYGDKKRDPLWGALRDFLTGKTEKYSDIFRQVPRMIRGRRNQHELQVRLAEIAYATYSLDKPITVLAVEDAKKLESWALSHHIRFKNQAERILSTEEEISIEECQALLEFSQLCQKFSVLFPDIEMQIQRHILDNVAKLTPRHFTMFSALSDAHQRRLAIECAEQSFQAWFSAKSLPPMSTSLEMIIDMGNVDGLFDQKFLALDPDFSNPSVQNFVFEAVSRGLLDVSFLVIVAKHRADRALKAGERSLVERDPWTLQLYERIQELPDNAVDAYQVLKPKSTGVELLRRLKVLAAQDTVVTERVQNLFWTILDSEIPEEDLQSGELPKDLLNALLYHDTKNLQKILVNKNLYAFLTVELTTQGEQQYELALANLIYWMNGGALNMKGGKRFAPDFIEKVIKPIVINPDCSDAEKVKALSEAVAKHLSDDSLDFLKGKIDLAAQSMPIFIMVLQAVPMHRLHALSTGILNSQDRPTEQNEYYKAWLALYTQSLLAPGEDNLTSVLCLEKLMGPRGGLNNPNLRALIQYSHTNGDHLSKGGFLKRLVFKLSKLKTKATAPLLEGITPDQRDKLSRLMALLPNRPGWLGGISHDTLFSGMLYCNEADIKDIEAVLTDKSLSEFIRFQYVVRRLAYIMDNPTYNPLFESQAHLLFSPAERPVQHAVQTEQVPTREESENSLPPNLLLDRVWHARP